MTATDYPRPHTVQTAETQWVDAPFGTVNTLYADGAQGLVLPAGQNIVYVMGGTGADHVEPLMDGINDTTYIAVPWTNGPNIYGPALAATSWTTFQAANCVDGPHPPGPGTYPPSAELGAFTCSDDAIAFGTTTIGIGQLDDSNAVGAFLSQGGSISYDAYLVGDNGTDGFRYDHHRLLYGDPAVSEQVFQWQGAPMIGGVPPLGFRALFVLIWSSRASTSDPFSGVDLKVFGASIDLTILTR